MQESDVSAETIIEQAVTTYLGQGEKNLEIGVSVGLIQGDTATYFNSGLANRKSGTLVQSDTVFLIGSIQKVFTSTLCASQVIQGKMSLDAQITDYLPKSVFKKGSAIRQVTAQDLATMTSGMARKIPDAGDFQPGYNLYHDMPPASELKTFWEGTNADGFNPTKKIGTHELYSNVGVVTLGFATVQAAGVVGGYPQLLQNIITGPLNMPDTKVDISDIPCDRIARGYTDKGKRVPSKYRGVGLNSTVIDMLNFLRANMFLTDQLPPNLVRAMSLAQTPHFGQPETGAIGLNWYINNLKTMQTIGNNNGSDELTVISKNGGNVGFSTYIAFIPQQQLGVVILTNGHPNPKNEKLGDAGNSILLQLANMPEDLPKDLLNTNDEGDAQDNT